jgi:hypothetical protein
MKVDDNPSPKVQNMVDAKLFKGKTKVLTSARAREAGTIDLEM